MHTHNQVRLRVRDAFPESPRALDARRDLLQFTSGPEAPVVPHHAPHPGPLGHHRIIRHEIFIRPARVLRPDVDDLRVDLAGVQPLQRIHQSFTGGAVAAAGVGHEEEDLLLLARRRCLCLRRAVGSDGGGGTRRERMRAPRVGPGDTHILRPREVPDCIDAGPSADATPAEGRRAAQEREARSETHVEAYAVR